MGRAALAVVLFNAYLIGSYLGIYYKIGIQATYTASMSNTFLIPPCACKHRFVKNIGILKIAVAASSINIEIQMNKALVGSLLFQGRFSFGPSPSSYAWYKRIRGRKTAYILAIALGL
jgi:hypothetical protein